MLVIIGGIIAVVGVLGGFAMEGGPFLVLMQFAEFMIIGCAALGSLLISTPVRTLKKIIAKTLGSLKGSPVSSAMYLDLLKLMFEVFQISRKEGLIALETHVERPEESPSLPSIRGSSRSDTSFFSSATPSASSYWAVCRPTTWKRSWTPI